MHTMFKGSISFGLVHIPIKLYAATEEKDIRLRFLHQECHHPVRYTKTCPVCDVKIEQDEIIKGYEYEDGKFVTLTSDELDNIGHKRSKNIEIVDFVDLSEIDPIYFNRSYFIGPNENGEKAYQLLKQAMEETNRIALAKITMRSKQHLAVIRTYKNALMMETIYYPDEVRKVEHVPALPEHTELNEKELTMAKQLVEQLTTPFEPEKFKDEYREQLHELIESKITGNEVKIAREVPETDIANLMEALEASIKQTKPKAKPKRAATKKKQTGS